MNYDLFLTGFVGGPDFDQQYIAYILQQKKDEPVEVFINSLGGEVATGLAVNSLFRAHGNVTVTLAGLNASAATLAALGAKNIKMERSSLFLVHRASLEFFDWANRNAEEIKEHAGELLKTASELEKVDFAIAQLYADKTETSVEAMIDLMNTAEWLTSDMCKDYGFVDEIIENTSATNTVLTNFDYFGTLLNSAGLPVPQMGNSKENFIQRIIAAIREALTPKNDAPKADAEPQEPTEPSDDQPTEPAIPNSSSQIPNSTEPSDDQPTEPSDPDDELPETGAITGVSGYADFADAYARSLALYNSLP